MADPLVIGVDLGGTKIAAGLVDGNGGVRERRERTTPTESQGALLVALEEAVAELLGPDVTAVGIGVPSIIDRATDGSVDDEVFHLSRQDGTPDPAAVLRYVVRHPGRVPGLARMARGAGLATARAATAAVAAVRSAGSAE